MRTCVRPAVSAICNLTSETLLLRLQTPERKDFKTPHFNNDWNFCWITNYEELFPRFILWAAVTIVSRHRYAPSSDTSLLVVLLRETCHPNYWLMSYFCLSFIHGKLRTFVPNCSKNTKCVVFRDVGEDKLHNVEMFVTCFLKKTSCFALSSPEGWAHRLCFPACNLQNTLQGIACFQPPSSLLPLQLSNNRVRRGLRGRHCEPDACF